MKRPSILVLLAATICGCALVFGAPLASGGNIDCTSTYGAVVINGDLTAGPGCRLEGTHVTGNVHVASNGSLAANRATIDGNVEIDHSGTNSICGTAIGGNVNVHDNAGPTTIDDACGNNTIGRDVEIHHNLAQVTISHTSVGGNLDCHHNSPPASTGTGGNTVKGKSRGECVTQVTTPCPASGCSTTTSDGNTAVTVNVPGGGKSGNLTVALSAPPPDDGCGVGEGGPLRPSGDLVTVDPPGGYTASNPITVDITFNFSQGLFQICKSNDGGRTFFQLPECTGHSEGPPPNVPCWEPLSSKKARIFMTSKDPAFNGHS